MKHRMQPIPSFAPFFYSVFKYADEKRIRIEGPVIKGLHPTYFKKLWARSANGEPCWIVTKAIYEALNLFATKALHSDNFTYAGMNIGEFIRKLVPPELRSIR